MTTFYKQMSKMIRARNNFFRFNFNSKRRVKRKRNKWRNEFNRLAEHFLQ